MLSPTHSAEHSRRRLTTGAPHPERRPRSCIAEISQTGCVLTRVPAPRTGYSGKVQKVVRHDHSSKTFVYATAASYAPLTTPQAEKQSEMPIKNSPGAGPRVKLQCQADGTIWTLHTAQAGKKHILIHIQTLHAAASVHRRARSRRMLLICFGGITAAAVEALHPHGSAQHGQHRHA